MTSLQERRQSQAQKLIKQLGEEYEHERGWMTCVGKWFGIDPSWITKIIGNRKEAKAAFEDGALQALGLSKTWFSDVAATKPEAHFRQWMADPKKPLRPIRVDADPAPVMLREPRATYGEPRTRAGAAEDAANPDHWLIHILHAKGIVEPDRVDAVCAELDGAFGEDALSPRLATKIVDLWLAADSNRSTATRARDSVNDSASRSAGAKGAAKLKPRRGAR